MSKLAKHVARDMTNAYEINQQILTEKTTRNTCAQFGG